MNVKLKKMFGRLHFWRSLNVRIFAIIILVGFVPSIILRHGILMNYEDRAVSVKTLEAQNQLKILANHLIHYGYLQETSSEVINAELNQLSSLYDGRVMVIDRNFKIIKDTYGISEGKTIISEEVIQCFKGTSISKYDANNGYIELTTPIVMTEQNAPDTLQGSAKPENLSIVSGVMLTSVSSDSIRLTMEILNRKAVVIEMIMFILIIGMAIVVSRILVKPFARVTQEINKVKEGYTDEPISVPDYVETEQIVDAFNQLLSRMKVLDDSRQEFVSNVSHELKTPLASMKVLADSLIMQENVPIELYQEFMQDIAAEIERENKIITDLLSLVKMDKKEADLNVSVVDINGLVELILKRLRPIARKRDVEVVFESIRPVTAEVDEVKLTLAISNLVENAVKYNKDHGWVKVLLDADHQFFTLEISDSGIGIPEADAEHIYERFYRVDKSHSKEIGGTGLGLAITRNAILMHRGSIKMSSVEGEGTYFTVKIPLTHPA